MRRLIALVARLYPRSWREEYEREFGALLEDVQPNWRVFGNVLGGAVGMQISDEKNWIGLAIGMSVLGAIIAGGASFTVPPRYVASASIGVTPQPDPLRPLPPEQLWGRAMERFAHIKAGALSRQSLAAIIFDPALDLYKAERTRMPLEDIENQMRRDLSIHQVSSAGDPVFEISFAYPDRARAQATVRAIADRLIQENAQENRFRTADYHDFWDVWTLAHRAKPVPPPPVGDTVAILKPPSLAKETESPTRMVLLASGAGVGLALGLLTAALQRRKHSLWRVCGYASAGWVLTLAASFLLPDRYTATAVMTISPATLTTDPLQAPPPATPVEQFLHRMEPLVLNRGHLSRMIQDSRLNLYADELRKKPIEDVIRNMVAHDIRIEPIGSGASVFRISFSHPDRKKAQDGANTLITLFIEESTKLARARATTGDELMKAIVERGGGEYLALLDAPTVPQKPEFPPRLAISLAGLLAGLSVGAFAPRLRTA